MELSEKSKEFYELYRVVRNEIATEEGYVLEIAIMLTFDRFLANMMQELEILIKSQEEQEQRGNLTEAGILYLNGLRNAMKIIK